MRYCRSFDASGYKVLLLKFLLFPSGILKARSFLIEMRFDLFYLLLIFFFFLRRCFSKRPKKLHIITYLKKKELHLNAFYFFFIFLRLKLPLIRALNIQNVYIESIYGTMCIIIAIRVLFTFSLFLLSNQ